MNERLAQLIREKADGESVRLTIDSDLRSARNEEIRKIIIECGVGEPLVSVNGQRGYVSRVDAWRSGAVGIYFQHMPRGEIPHFSDSSSNGSPIRDEELLTFLNDWRRENPATEAPPREEFPSWSPATVYSTYQKVRFIVMDAPPLSPRRSFLPVIAGALAGAVLTGLIIALALWQMQ